MSTEHEHDSDSDNLPQVEYESSYSGLRPVDSFVREETPARPTTSGADDETLPSSPMKIIENDSSQYCPVNQVVMTGEGTRQSLVQRLLVGRPLRSEDMPDNPINKRLGLAIFASDALSSVAYATQEMLAVLLLAGMAAFSLSMPIAGAVGVLLVLVTLSYRQIIFGYPFGGGSYTVTRDNLGDRAAKVAGAALLTDYTLTVSVSMAAGVEMLASAFPVLVPYRVLLCVLLIVGMMLLNLRGVRETTRMLAFPTYFFLAMLLLLLFTGLWRWSQGTLPQVSGLPTWEGVAQPLTIFLILRAFTAGSVAITGMEAISIRSLAFQRPRKRNAAAVIVIIGGMLMLSFLGITFLAWQTQALPLAEEMVLSQIARTILGAESAYYYLMIVSTAVILVAATNTSFARFPRLAAIQAADGYLPRWLALRGHRLAFSWGIVMLAVAAIVLVLLFQARLSDLIPLYAVAVFLSMTMAQASMVIHWRRVSHIPEGDEIRTEHSALFPDKHWRIKMVLNGVGCAITAVITLVVAITNFLAGTWVALAMIGSLFWLFFRVRQHYSTVARSLSLDNYQGEADIDASRHTVVTLVGDVHRGTLVAARYARSIHASKHVAVHVESNPQKTAKVQERWQQWMPNVPLVVVDSPYRTLIKPLVKYVETLARDDHTELVTIVVPQFVCVRWWHHLLHNQTVLLIRGAFLFDRDKVVIEVPFRLEDEQ